MEKSLRKKLLKNEDVSEGAILFAPLFSKNTYLIDKDGEIVHSWKGSYPPSNSAYLLEDGTLLRTCSPGILANKNIRSTATGFYVQKISREGKIIWNFRYSNKRHRLHHDVCPLPNGNILMLVYEKKTAKEAIAAGREPESIKDGFLLSERIIEVKPTIPYGGEIVWSWDLWNHLVQDHDSAKKNFGNVSEHPELLDINFSTNNKPDWVHLNSIDYDAQNDQILVSSRTLSEIWVIDHSTTKKESSAHAGGKSGKGGDILYRWGNPQVYGRGKQNDQQLFGQHDAQWIGKGLPGEGNILIYNNGDGRPKKEYSSIEEIALPIKKSAYLIENGKAYGPKKPKWYFSGKKEDHFYSQHISGVQRLENGNTLICVGGKGYFFEINSKGEKVWDYQNTFCDENIYEKNLVEVKNYTTSKPGKSSREKEAVFNFRRYSVEKKAKLFTN